MDCPGEGALSTKDVLARLSAGRECLLGTRVGTEVSCILLETVGSSVLRSVCPFLSMIVVNFYCLEGYGL